MDRIRTRRMQPARKSGITNTRADIRHNHPLAAVNLRQNPRPRTWFAAKPRSPFGRRVTRCWGPPPLRVGALTADAPVRFAKCDGDELCPATLRT
jgi:hypothetical protein